MTVVTPNPAPRPGRLRRWHRLAGLGSAIGLLWLALTGLPLFLSDSLGLARLPAPAFIRHGLYRLAAPVRRSIKVLGHEIAEPLAGTWTFDGRPLPNPVGTLLAAMPAGPTWFLAGSAGIMLVDGQGGVIDHVAGASIGLGRLVAAGWLVQEALHARSDETGRTRGAVGDEARVTDGNRATDEAHGSGSFCVADTAGRIRCSSDGLDWQPVDPGVVNWLPVEPVDAADESAPVITVERVLQDLHTLRFLGPFAAVLGVIVGLAMVFLAVSGLFAALAPNRRSRRSASPPGPVNAPARGRPSR